MTTLHIIEAPLQSLRASEQPRPLITADVDRMAASLREVGLISPIRIRKAGDGYDSGLCVEAHRKTIREINNI